MKASAEMFEMGEYIKIPGLQPEETHAVVYLTKQQLDKLSDRVAEAKDRLYRRVERMSDMEPGTPVYATFSFHGIPHGTYGIVVDRSSVAYPLPDYHLAIQFEGLPSPVAYSVFFLRQRSLTRKVK